MSSRTINISMPTRLLKRLDKAAKDDYASRSDFIREAVIGKLRANERLASTGDWLLLEELSKEITEAAEARGITTDQDFVRVVKQVRAEQAAKQGR